MGEGSELRLEYREQAIDLMQELMRHKMFHRAKKIPVPDKKKKKEDTDGEASLPPSPQARGRKGKGDKEKEKEKGEEREKKKRKIRLEMHNDQLFLDGNDAYVWIYDPTPWYYYIAGGAMCSESSLSVCSHSGQWRLGRASTIFLLLRLVSLSSSLS